MNPFLDNRIQERLLLASASPRRKEILENLGFEFEILPADVDEDEVPWDDPVTGVKLLAELKAVDVQRFRPRKTIIAADTIVLCNSRILGKPADEREAVEMLELLSGKEHEVITGVALVSQPGRRIIEAERTRVTFRKLTDNQIRTYVETGEPFDKAGAYAIQGWASVFVDAIVGCYFNVVGLPVPLLFRMFERLQRELGDRR
jgi:septum formation protein